MKASELIYRLARAIEERGDIPVTMAIQLRDGETVDSIDVKYLDINTSAYGCEIYGEEQ